MEENKTPLKLLFQEFRSSRSNEHQRMPDLLAQIQEIQT